MGEQGFSLNMSAIAPVCPVSLGDLPGLLQKTRADAFHLDRSEIEEQAFRAFDPALLARAVAPEVSDAPDEAGVPVPSTLIHPAIAENMGAGGPEAKAAHPQQGYAEGWEEGYRAGLEEGHRNGEAAGRAEMQAKLGAALDLLAAAHGRLASPTAAESAGFGAVILSAVRGLASERAGQAIDACPTPFLRRIDRMAERIAQGAGQVELRLNPDDLKALTPVLAQSPQLASARIAADPTLKRGDVDLRVPGVHLADLIAPPDEAVA